MNKLFFLGILWVGYGIEMVAQEKHWIFFADKEQVSQKVQRPEAFLSERAIARRQRFGIAIDATDVPVSAQYLDSLRQLGFDIVHVSKWFNAVSVRATPEQLVKLNTFEYVTQIRPVKSLQVKRYDAMVPLMTDPLPPIAAKTNFVFDYGAAKDQIQLHNGQVLHELGFTGQNILISVHDGGFVGAEPSGPFNTLHRNGQIVHTWDFVRGDTNVYRIGSHGSRVLSTMAFFSDGFMVGTAPDASYLLFRTEDEQSETRQEEDNWVAAAEMADSIGADMINTSLGYNLFDDPVENYTFDDMDGRTTIISRGAVMAARKGMLLCTSAGNEGARPWRHITAPADADSILTVGAVTTIGEPAGFSSEGPTADGRIKPNVVGQGVAAAVIAPNGLAFNSGTSFSSPIICGLVACLWEAFPHENNIQIIKRVERNSSQFDQPDFKMGFGIPDFSKALTDEVKPDNDDDFVLAPNPFGDWFNIVMPTEVTGDLTIRMYNHLGALQYETTVDSRTNRYRVTGLNSLASGFYTLVVMDAFGKNYVKRVVRFVP
jgi:serine protease AprX